MLRISSMSREGPLLMPPTQPAICMAVVMLPPDRPTLLAISGGKRCSNTKMVGCGEASMAPMTSAKESRL